MCCLFPWNNCSCAEFNKAHESLSLKLIWLSRASPLCISSFAERTQAHRVFSASGSPGESSLICECTKKNSNSLVRNFSRTDAMLSSFIWVEPVSSWVPLIPYWNLWGMVEILYHQLISKGIYVTWIFRRLTPSWTGPLWSGTENPHQGKNVTADPTLRILNYKASWDPFQIEFSCGPTTPLGFRQWHQSSPAAG